MTAAIPLDLFEGELGHFLYKLVHISQEVEGKKCINLEKGGKSCETVHNNRAFP